MQSVYCGPELRAWQREAIEIWDKHREGIIQAVPGSGKTITAIKMICDKLEENPKLKILIVCPRLTLIEQWIEGILKNSTIKRSEIYEVSSNNESKAYVCAQGKIFNFRVFISTFHQIKQFFNECKWKDFEWFLIVDEMHNTTENYKFPNAPIKYKLGLSATPRKRGKDSDFNLGGILYTYTFNRALQDKIILDPVIKIVFYSVNKQLFKKIQNEKDETIDLVESAYDDFLPNDEMVAEHKAFVQQQKQLKEIGDEQGAQEEEPDVFTSKNTDFIGIQRILENQFHIGKKDSVQTLVFVNRIKKADLLNQMLAEKFSQRVSQSYHSKSDKYNTKNHFNDLKRQFADGSFNVLISVGTLGEGIDFPYASHGIIASPIYNPTSFVQKVGRLLRAYKGHQKAVIYYYVPSELVTRLLTDEKIEPNYFKLVIKIADENGDLYFVDRVSLGEKKGSLSELLIQGSAYERNEDIHRIKIPHDLDSIMRFFRRVYPNNIKNFKRFYEIPASEQKKDKVVQKVKIDSKVKIASKKLSLKKVSPANDLLNASNQQPPVLSDSSDKVEKKEKEIDFTPLRNELAKNNKIVLVSAKNLIQNLSGIIELQKRFFHVQFSDFAGVKSFVKEGLKHRIITKIKYGQELERIAKEDSVLTLSEQDMLCHAIGAELFDFCSKQKNLLAAIQTLESSIKLIEDSSKKGSLSSFAQSKEKNIKDQIAVMNRISKTFFDLQSFFLDELDLSELARNTPSKDQKFILTIGKDIFLTKHLSRKYSYPEDFGLSRWREEKEPPKVVVSLSAIEKFAKRLMFLMGSANGDSIYAIDDWKLLKQNICNELNCSLLKDEDILLELEKHKFESEFSFEKLFFVSEAIKKQKKK